MAMTFDISDVTHNFDWLPDHILENVFENLQTPDKLSVFLVSKNWNSVARRSVKINVPTTINRTKNGPIAYQVNQQSVPHVPERAMTYFVLEVGAFDRGMLLDTAKEDLEKHRQHLECLQIKICEHRPKIQWTVLFEFLEKFPKLVRVRISDWTHKPPTWPGQLDDTCKTFKIEIIDGPTWITDSCFIEKGKFEKVEILDLSHSFHINSKFVKSLKIEVAWKFVPEIFVFPNLRTLWLDNLMFNLTVSINHYYPGLETMTLDTCEIGARERVTLDRLKYLCVANCKGVGYNIVAPQLEILKIEFDHRTSEIIPRKYLQMILRCKKLKELHVTCQITHRSKWKTFKQLTSPAFPFLSVLHLHLITHAGCSERGIYKRLNGAAKKVASFTQRKFQ